VPDGTAEKLGEAEVANAPCTKSPSETCADRVDRNAGRSHPSGAEILIGVSGRKPPPSGGGSVTCAEIRAGELLREMEKAKRGPDRDTGQRSQRSTPDSPPTLHDLGISRDQSSRWQKLAALPRANSRYHCIGRAL
jgi:hypothetical protein